MLARLTLLTLFFLTRLDLTSACGAVARVPSVPIHTGEIGSIVHGKKKRCLHADADVLMADGSVMKAGELRVGDGVWGEHGQLDRVVLTPVVDTDVVQEFIRLETETGAGTTLTPDHAVFSRRCGGGEWEGWPIKPAVSLMLGECVPMVDGGEERVVGMESVMATGRVQPITQSGKLVVGRVIVSCYDYTQHNDTQAIRHAPMQPIRTMYTWAETIYNTLAHEKYSMAIIDGLIRGLGLERLYYK